MTTREDSVIFITYPELVDELENAIVNATREFFQDINEGIVIDARDEVLCSIVSDVLYELGVENAVVLRNGSVMDRVSPTGLYQMVKDTNGDLIATLNHRITTHLIPTIRALNAFVYIRVISSRVLVGCFLTTARTSVM